MLENLYPLKIWAKLVRVLVVGFVSELVSEGLAPFGGAAVSCPFPSWVCSRELQRPRPLREAGVVLFGAGVADHAGLGRADLLLFT